mmetsp:Transcript_42677/g.135593  ORF Transcript_42677/g.135593 Transcript_42677/m.135593 type:complete len:209 (+) Transcript_42677:400-1026(+)
MDVLCPALGSALAGALMPMLWPYRSSIEKAKSGKSGLDDRYSKAPAMYLPSVDSLPRKASGRSSTHLWEPCSLASPVALICILRTSSQLWGHPQWLLAKKAAVGSRSSLQPQLVGQSDRRAVLCILWHSDFKLLQMSSMEYRVGILWGKRLGYRSWILAMKAMRVCATMAFSQRTCDMAPEELLVARSSTRWKLASCGGKASPTSERL